MDKDFNPVEIIAELIEYARQCANERDERPPCIDKAAIVLINLKLIL